MRSGPRLSPKSATGAGDSVASDQSLALVLLTNMRAIPASRGLSARFWPFFALMLVTVTVTVTATGTATGTADDRPRSRRCLAGGSA